MAFKMKGSAFKLNEVATKSTMKLAKKAMKMKEEESAMKLKTSYKMKEAMAKMKDPSAMKAKDVDALGDKGSALIPSHIRKVFPNLTNAAYNKNKSTYDDKAQSVINKEKSAMKQAKPDYPDIDGDGNTKESMKQAAADKKSPMEQKEDIMVMATRPGSRMVQKGKKTKIYSKEEDDKGKRRNITKTVVNEKTGKIKDRKISEARAGRQIERAQRKAARGKGSVSSALKQTSPMKQDIKFGYHDDKGNVVADATKDVVPAESNEGVGRRSTGHRTDTDRAEYQTKVGDMIRQTARPDWKEEKKSKEKINKELSKKRRKGVNIDFRKTKDARKGLGGRIGYKLIPKISRKGTGITFNQ